MKEIERLKQQINTSESRLSNPGFIKNASEDTIAKENKKLSDFRTKLDNEYYIIESDICKKHYIKLEDKAKWFQYLIEELRFAELNYDINILLENIDSVYAPFDRENDLIKLLKY